MLNWKTTKAPRFTLTEKTASDKPLVGKVVRKRSPKGTNVLKLARENTPAKQTINRVQAWLDAGKNRDIVIDWQWNQIKRFDRMGAIVAMENGEEICRKVYQNGDMAMPNLDFRKTNSGSYRHQALEVMVGELEARDRRNCKEV